MKCLGLLYEKYALVALFFLFFFVFSLSSCVAFYR